MKPERIRVYYLIDMPEVSKPDRKCYHVAMQWHDDVECVSGIAVVDSSDKPEAFWSVFSTNTLIFSAFTQSPLKSKSLRGLIELIDSLPESTRFTGALYTAKEVIPRLFEIEKEVL
jgi:hypothetical protein